MLSQKHKGGRLEAVRSFRAQPSVTDDAIFNYLSCLGTPRALTVWMLYSHDEHDQLTQLDIEPSNYCEAYLFRLDYCATCFLSKASFLKTTFDRKQKALAKFSQYEEQCRVTNRRFLNSALDPQNHGSNVWLLNATKRKISEILTDFSGDELFEEAGWGPGVTTLLKGDEVSAFNKFRDERGITHDLYALVGPIFHEAYPSWHPEYSALQQDTRFAFEVGNVIVTVPKNSKADRVIAIEPGINSWFQKGVGTMIRKRLRRVGINLNSQVQNQQLAKKGSLKGDHSLATVDFSSASDSISTEVVRELVPPRWFSVMDACRAKIGMHGKDLVRWQKFSSMGNGFTFELESLIFFAAASAVQELLGIKTLISVFGDDVVLDSRAYDLYSSFCGFLGFTVNLDKSFSGSGPFRESCGSHYFDGVDCKPIFLKEKIQNAESFYKLANNIRLLSHRFCNYSGCDGRFRTCWNHLFEGVPELLQLRVPRQAGDTGFISNFDEACPTRARNGIEGFYYTALTSPGITRSSDHRAMLQTRLWQARNVQHEYVVGARLKGRALALFYAENSSIDLTFSSPRKLKDKSYQNDYTLRGRSKRTVTRSLISRWYNLGEWH